MTILSKILPKHTHARTRCTIKECGCGRAKFEKCKHPAIGSGYFPISTCAHKQTNTHTRTLARWHELLRRRRCIIEWTLGLGENEWSNKGKRERRRKQKVLPYRARTHTRPSLIKSYNINSSSNSNNNNNSSGSYYELLKGLAGGGGSAAEKECWKSSGFGQKSAQLKKITNTRTHADTHKFNIPHTHPFARRSHLSK